MCAHITHMCVILLQRGLERNWEAAVAAFLMSLPTAISSDRLMRSSAYSYEKRERCAGCA